MGSKSFVTRLISSSVTLARVRVTRPPGKTVSESASLCQGVAMQPSPRGEEDVAPRPSASVTLVVCARPLHFILPRVSAAPPTVPRLGSSSAILELALRGRVDCLLPSTNENPSPDIFVTSAVSDELPWAAHRYPERD